MVSCGSIGSRAFGSAIKVELRSTIMNARKQQVNVFFHMQQHAYTQAWSMVGRPNGPSPVSTATTMHFGSYDGIIDAAACVYASVMYDEQTHD